MPSQMQLSILSLMRSTDPKYKDMDDQTLQEEIQKVYRVDIENDSEERLDILVEKLIKARKAYKPAVAPAVLSQTPAQRFTQQQALTDFKEGDRVRHTKLPEWGIGDILTVEQYSMSGDCLQKLNVLFGGAGRKVLIVRPGMLERLNAR